MPYQIPAMLSKEEKSKLEEQFKLAQEKFKEEIGDKLRQAEKLVSEVVTLSEKYGIPFESYAVLARDSSWRYVPGSMWELYRGLSASDFCNVVSLTDWIDSFEYSWQNSSMNC